MEIILLSLCFLTNLIVLAVIFYMGAFLVSMNERHDKMFVDLIEIISENFSETTVPPVNNKSQTWDQKYEQELDRISTFMRQNSGLSDIPTVRSYDSPTPEK